MQQSGFGMWQGCRTTWLSEPAGVGCGWPRVAHGCLRGGRPAAPLPPLCLLARDLLVHGWDVDKTHPVVSGIVNPHPRWQWGVEKEGKIPPGLGSPTPGLKGHLPLPSSMAGGDGMWPTSRQLSVPKELAEGKGNRSKKQPSCLTGTACCCEGVLQP